MPGIISVTDRIKWLVKPGSKWLTMTRRSLAPEQRAAKA